MEPVTRIKTKTPSPYQLTSIHIDTHDTNTFRFGLPANATLDLLPGDHLYVHATISKYLHDQHVGDSVLMSGPNTGGHWVDGMAKKVGFVAGGTGITPMIAIIRWLLAKKLDVEMRLVFANKTEADIIYRNEWEQNVREHPNFHTYHVLEQPPAGWSGGTGRVTADILRYQLPSPGPETIVFLCGPPPMVDALEATLRELGYPEQAIILP